ncbi:DUF3140 domain-containing protein [Allorhizocola rhizosphaerae]|uniref:DUF3140 domain-containing protein n=1 Tax=Allorhizocola rhizosphaerae TaxID=1872709 RepID=UPI000E3C3E7A|nr:DUF3140 domain-containing protein [Allorhizocola rhizosphaerae]
MARTTTEVDVLWQEFHTMVNMTSAQLRDWLAANPTVRGQEAPGVAREEPEGDLESMGWRVVSILGKRKTDLTTDDKQLMELVIGILQDRLANRPQAGQPADDDWRREVMLLGHDPLRAS